MLVELLLLPWTIFQAALRVAWWLVWPPVPNGSYSLSFFAALLRFAVHRCVITDHGAHFP